MPTYSSFCSRLTIEDGVSILLGPAAVESQINTHRFTIIINCLADGSGSLSASWLLIANPYVVQGVSLDLFYKFTTDSPQVQIIQQIISFHWITICIFGSPSVRFIGHWPAGKREQKQQAGFRGLWVQQKECPLEVSSSETAQFTEALRPIYTAQVRVGRKDGWSGDAPNLHMWTWLSTEDLDNAPMG